MTASRKGTYASLSSDRYEDVFTESIEDPEEFWGRIGKLVSWTKPWTKVLDNTQEPVTKWFVEGQLNACYNAVDRHVNAGRGSKIALIFDSPLIGVSKKITYLELQQKVSKLAGALAALEVKKGDRVIIYMPVIPETCIAMLACARLGAVHSVVFGGFAACELSTRIQHCTPKVIITASCGIEPTKIIRYLDHLEEAITLSRYKPTKCIVFQRRELVTCYLDSKHYLDWDAVIEDAVPHPCVPVDANDPLYILYTSGTTGNPKGILRPVGGHLAVLTWTMDVIYGITPDDVWWAISDFGWVLGHSYIVYGPLCYGTTSIIYEGKPTTTPDPAQYYRIIDQYKVSAALVVPTALRLLRTEDPNSTYCKKFNISSLRHVFVAGEHCDATTKLWTEKVFNAPVLNHWWQTEIGSPMTASCVKFKDTIAPTKFTVGQPFAGFDIQVMKDDGTKTSSNELGRIVVKLPLPPGAFTNLYQAEDKFLETYFSRYPGYYDTMDAGYVDEKGLVYVVARDDDVINIAGHRLSTLAIESVILAHPEVSDACVISVPDHVKAEVPFCLFVMRNDDSNEQSIVRELVAMVREAIGPIASFKLAGAVSALPRTRSGKTCRKSMADLARGKEIKISPTVANPEVYSEIKATLKKWGFCRNLHFY